MLFTKSTVWIYLFSLIVSVKGKESDSGGLLKKIGAGVIFWGGCLVVVVAVFVCIRKRLRREKQQPDALLYESEDEFEPYGALRKTLSN